MTCMRNLPGTWLYPNVCGLNADSQLIDTNDNQFSRSVELAMLGTLKAREFFLETVFLKVSHLFSFLPGRFLLAVAEAAYRVGNLRNVQV